MCQLCPKEYRGEREGGIRTLTLQAPFMLVLEQALNSAAEAETARTARTAVSFIVLDSKALGDRGSSDWRFGGAEKCR